ncbi:MAG: hypothetical protein ABDH16_02180 [Thermodesulfovibrionaceae bacterium]
MLKGTTLERRKIYVLLLIMFLILSLPGIISATEGGGGAYPNGAEDLWLELYLPQEHIF